MKALIGRSVFEGRGPGEVLPPVDILRACFEIFTLALKQLR
jgi:hypothetical protein